jgi:hypothetical protein
MGLHITHGCWSGAYSGFREFRDAVGMAAGMPFLTITDPDRYDYGGKLLDIDWDRITHEQIAGDWGGREPLIERIGYDPPLTDPVLYLLVHSDCDGVLRGEYLPQLKQRLEEIEPQYDAIADDYLQGRLRQFIDGLEDAIEAGADVEDA